MKDKFLRAKQFVNDHTLPVVYGVGALTGSALTFYYLKNHPFPVLPKGLEVEIQGSAKAFASEFAERGGAVIHCQNNGLELILTASQ